MESRADLGPVIKMMSLHRGPAAPATVQVTVYVDHVYAVADEADDEADLPLTPAALRDCLDPLVARAMQT